MSFAAIIIRRPHGQQPSSVLTQCHERPIRFDLAHGARHRARGRTAVGCRRRQRAQGAVNGSLRGGLVRRWGPIGPGVLQGSGLTPRSALANFHASETRRPVRGNPFTALTSLCEAQNYLHAARRRGVLQQQLDDAGVQTAGVSLAQAPPSRRWLHRRTSPRGAPHGAKPSAAPCA